MIKINQVALHYNYANLRKNDKTEQTSSTRNLASNPINLVDVNHNKLLVNRPQQVSFSGGLNNLTALEANLMRVLDIAKTASERHNESSVIFINKSPNFIKDVVQDVKKLFSKTIDKIYYIEDQSIEHPISLSLDGGFHTLMNHSEAPVYIGKTEVPKYDYMGFFIGEDSNVIEVNSKKIRLFTPDDLTKKDLITKDLPSIKWIDLKKHNDEAIQKLNEDYLTYAADGFKPDAPAIKEPNLPLPKGKPVRTKKNKASKSLSNKTIGTGRKFADIGGYDDVKTEMEQKVIFPIIYPEAYKRINHGVIAKGPPGTGKTLIMEATGNESGVNILKLKGTELEEMWVGKTEENIRSFFEDLKKRQPIFAIIDEIDALGRARSGSESGRHDAKSLNTFLACMSELTDNDKVFIGGTTNMSELLDPAFTRPGRFGVQIEVGLPDKETCRKILDIHAKENPIDFAHDVNFDEYAAKFNQKQFSGADIGEGVVPFAIDFAYKRAGITQKMKDRSFEPSDLMNVFIEKVDLDNAIEKITKDRKSSRRLGL